MSFLTEDFDPRLLLLTIDANFKPPRGSTTPVSGLLVLSKVGLHFYAYDARKRDGTLDRTGIHHCTFSDQTGRGGIALNPLLPLGHLDHSRFTSPLLLRLGYLASWGSGTGGIIAGVTNMARGMAAKDERAAFLEALEETKQQAPPLPEQPRVNPHLVRMSYFADASALGPALFYADRALVCAKLQEVNASGMGFFKRRSALSKERGHLAFPTWYFGAGEDKKHPLPTITPEQLLRVKRLRAWLLIDGQRYDTLAGEARGKWAEADAEVLLTYGVALARLGSGEQAASFLHKALLAEPANPRIIAGAAWGLALQGRTAEAQQMLASVPTSAQRDRHALLLMGCTAEVVGSARDALTLYVDSAELARGYFQGTVACQRALALAKKMDSTLALRLANHLTTVQPEQREAWEGLAQIADRAGNLSLARQAQERVATMSGVLVS